MIKRILFVCTGNICRSPMAKAMFEDMVRNDPVLSSARIEVSSAGMTPTYNTASSEAVEVMREYGLSLAGHQSRAIDSSLVAWADLILTMESWQKALVVASFPAASSKTFTLAEYVGEDGDVPDPYGGGIDDYRECAVRLQSLLIKAAEKLIHIYGPED
jgi:protein-tyrosine phosphatase